MDLPREPEDDFSAIARESHEESNRRLYRRREAGRPSAGKTAMLVAGVFLAVGIAFGGYLGFPSPKAHAAEVDYSELWDRYDAAVERSQSATADNIEGHSTMCKGLADQVEKKRAAFFAHFGRNPKYIPKQRR